MNTRTRENTNEASDFIAQLNGAVRENPVSAGLVGLGVLWMFFGSKNIAQLSNRVPIAAGYAADAVRGVADSAGAASSDVAGKVTDVARDASDVMTSGAQGALESISSGVAKLDASRAAEYGRDLGQSLQKNMASTFEAQPLLLGLVGVGIGVGIASMFSTTNIEQEFVGNAATKVKERLVDIASAARQRAGDVVEDVKGEAAEQGLTASSAGESIHLVAKKVRSTADAAKESILTSSP